MRLIWWIRRDFRLNDNTALQAALSDADQVIPVFILDNVLLNAPRTRGPRLAWMLDALHMLKADLRKYGASLVIRRGNPAQELLAVCRETQAHGVYFNRDYSPYATQRDQAVVQALEEAGFTAQSFKDLVIHEAGEFMSGQGKPYRVYTPYARKWRTLPKPSLMESDNFNNLGKLRVPETIRTIAIPSATELGVIPCPDPIAAPGELAAQERLKAFVDGPIFHYDVGRNLPADDGTSILSLYLRWGMVSPRQCYWTAQQALTSASSDSERESVNVWVGELIWREFNYQNLTINPAAVNHSVRPEYDRIIWEDREDWLAAWSAGQTGYPIVDAGMRQLNTTGWMHNRVRMIVASFLCKDLLIDWRHGESVFMQRLLDGDIANNIGNWQWVAGTGTDATPYFRIFNPTSQGQNFDPNGEYVRHWCPELREVPTRFVHHPSLMTVEQQQQYHCIIGQDYPAPLVDHETQRQHTLAMYRAAKSV